MIAKERGVSLELARILEDKIRSEGYSNLRQFWLAHQMTMSFSYETCRRLLTPDETKDTAPATFVLIAMKLNFSREDIKEMLHKYFKHSRELEDVLSIMGDGTYSKLTTEEKGVLDLFHRFESVSPDAVIQMCSALDMAAMAVGIESKDITKILSKGGKRRR